MNAAPPARGMQLGNGLRPIAEGEKRGKILCSGVSSHVFRDHPAIGSEALRPTAGWASNHVESTPRG
jgi:hypothetical protein